MCFSCGMEMRSIKAEDDPWILHVKYSSKCTFVTQEKDPAFINAHAVDYSKLPHREEEDFGLITPCKMCKRKNINTVFVPCSHYVTCERCAQKENHCLECNAPILERVRAYTS
ncbi:baculoviral IAP repeat-containing protein 7-like [Ruditapes philippinarum]|uniref:baculoviral IAP repeat-containing protein 7-like n=1 Tax=Ruditapes philippinarum TaxID=129788 RepID=UPI00295C1008|nr:baculoviral IAP repeat-containing protein 7-like [Ruditapes philippinarum]